MYATFLKNLHKIQLLPDSTFKVLWLKILHIISTLITEINKDNQVSINFIKLIEIEGRIKRSIKKPFAGSICVRHLSHKGQ